MDLFGFISKDITADIECYAFGGTAMMFYGYKNDTKDVDILFEKEANREEFVRVLQNLGFEEKTPGGIYLPEKLKDKHRPMMYVKGEGRFDLFANKIFHTVISPKMKEDIYAMHEFRGKHTLKVKVLRKESIVMLKSVTERKNDFDDIRLITEKDKHFDWQYLVDEAIWQWKNGDTWVLMDVEKVIQELKKHVFIEEGYLKQLYEAGKRRG